MLVQFSSAPGDVRSLVCHALEVRRKFHRGNDAAQIGRDRLKAQQQIDSVLVHLFFELIDFFIVGDGDSAQFVVALEQSGNGAIETALGQARHEENVVAQGGGLFVEGGEDVIRFHHDEQGN